MALDPWAQAGAPGPTLRLGLGPLARSLGSSPSGPRCLGPSQSRKPNPEPLAESGPSGPRCTRLGAGGPRPPSGARGGFPPFPPWPVRHCIFPAVLSQFYWSVLWYDFFFWTLQYILGLFTALELMFVKYYWSDVSEQYNIPTCVGI